jgi:hypothetical protein
MAVVEVVAVATPTQLVAAVADNLVLALLVRIVVVMHWAEIRRLCLWVRAAGYPAAPSLLATAAFGMVVAERVVTVPALVAHLFGVVGEAQPLRRAFQFMVALGALA